MLICDTIDHYEGADIRLRGGSPVNPGLAMAKVTGDTMRGESVAASGLRPRETF